MFRKLFMVGVAIIAISIALPKKAEAAYPSGSSVGASLSAGYPSQGLNITGKFDNVPLVFGASFGFGSGYFALNITGDWWGLQLPLGRAGDADVSMYLGPGFALSTQIGSVFAMDLGIRMPVGFSFVVQKNWEIFLEPSIGLNLIGFAAWDGGASLRVLGSSLGDDFSFGLGALLFAGQFGFRYWF